MLSKIFWEIVQPGQLFVVLSVVGILLWRIRGSRFGQHMAITGAVLLTGVIVLPVSNWVLAPLENRFPRPQSFPTNVTGIIVLGGALDLGETVAHGIPSLNDAAERMTEFAALIRRYPSAKYIFTGGSGAIFSSELTEADVAKQLMDELGLDTSRIIFENKSRNTYENALFSKRLLNPSADESWILVTSAAHMPRSVGIFRHLGWPVIPDPVAYKSNDGGFSNDMGIKFYYLDTAVREWVGLVAYRLLGKTDSVFPGP